MDQLTYDSGDGTSPLLQVRAVSKSFSGVRVLSEVSLAVEAGEVHALMGENGAGKSTLMKILAGLHLPDSGSVVVSGRALTLGSAHAALKSGIAMIHQELLPFLDLTVAENIFMGHEPASRFLGWVKKEEMRRQSRQLLARLGLQIAPERKMRHLRIAEMQIVEIAKALAHGARIILMDEPTSALSQREAEALFRIIADLRQRGTAVIYISHKLEEVLQLANRVTVLRDGFWVDTVPAQSLTREKLISLMVGRPVDEVVPRKTNCPENSVALSVHGLGRSGRFRDISFELKAGEVLGIAGLMGAGRSEVVNAIYGLEPAETGEIRVAGKPVRIRSPQDALHAGIGLVTEDRKTFGLVPTLGLHTNITLAALWRWCRSGFIRQAVERQAADGQVRALSIRGTGANRNVSRLSGGNQQKVVLARTLLTEPQILLLDEPTRGIDLAAKAEVHALIRGLANAGKAVAMVSSELTELLALSDRILVMREGTLAGELSPARFSSEEILNLAMPG